VRLHWESFRRSLNCIPSGHRFERASAQNAGREARSLRGVDDAPSDLLALLSQQPELLPFAEALVRERLLNGSGPGSFQKSVTATVADVLAPDEEIDETVCENNQYTGHVSAK
jgi:hypothetical protein